MCARANSYGIPLLLGEVYGKPVGIKAVRISPEPHENPLGRWANDPILFPSHPRFMSIYG